MDNTALPRNIWHVYILKCKDKTLYTGIAKDLAKRVLEHNFGKAGAKYTRSRRPVELVYSEQVASRSAAAKREQQIKRLSLAGKIKLISAADCSASDEFGRSVMLG